MTLRLSLKAVCFVPALVFAVACGSDSSPSTTAQKPGVASSVIITSSPAASSPAGASAGSIAVTVLDAAARPVPGVVVTFTTIGSVTLAQAVVTTDASGVAATQVTAGSVAGPVSIRAAANGVTNAVTATITVVAGATARVILAPETVRLVLVGDTARVTAIAQDQFGNPSGAITYSVTDPTLVSIDQAGLIRALRQGGSALAISTSNGKADTTTVTVLPAGSSLCTGFAALSPLNVGQSQTFSGTQYGCISGSTAGAEYTVVAFNSSTDGGNSVNTSVLGSGLNVPPSTSVIGVDRAAESLAAAQREKTLDESFHLNLLRGAKDRFQRRSRIVAARSVSATGVSSAAVGIIPASAKVGDLITLNVSANYCDSPINRALRVSAIGSRSIVLSDTLNPANGFTPTDYQRIATNFDTLVYPLDVAAFGGPTDIDNNGKVALIFSRVVNELADSSSGSFVGGFFNPRDIYPRKAAVAEDDCPTSNEGEMFYLVVPAPAGIKGITHTVGQIDSLINGIVAHELQHLINSERRVYVNFAASAFEDIWLNEGLSHIAEELLFYRESGFTPRQNLDDPTVRLNNPARYPFFVKDAVSNLTRFGNYLQNPGGNSPYANDDQLATRGATWSFLRYAADRLGTTDGTLWQRMVNSTTTGLATVSSALGTDPAPFFRDWAVANFMDDFAGGTDTRYQHKSWNYRDILTVTLTRFNRYPLLVRALSNNVKSDLSVRGGSASYLRFAVSAAKEALLTFTSGGGVPAAPLQFIVIRTK